MSKNGLLSSLSPKMLAQIAETYSYVGLWMTVSISVIVFNKWLLAFAGFPFPIALTMWHMFFCSCIALILVKVAKVVPSHNMSVSQYCRSVMPIGFLYAISLWLSNTSYLYLSVSFIQMTKSLMPGLVFISGIALGNERYSHGIAACMLWIAAGVFVCALGEQGLSMTGLTVQITALGFEAIRLSLVQILMTRRGIKMNPFQSLFYVSPACFICLSVPFFVVELPKLVAINYEFTNGMNAVTLLLNACTAFVLNLAVFLLIGKTSALTMNIAGVIKDWLLISFSYFGFKAPLTPLTLAGYIFCCSGVGYYNYNKLQAMKKSSPATQITDREKLLPVTSPSALSSSPAAAAAVDSDSEDLDKDG